MPAAAVGVPVLPLGVAVEVDAIVAGPSLTRSIPGPAGFAHRGLHLGRAFPRTAWSPSPPRSSSAPGSNATSG